MVHVEYGGYDIYVNDTIIVGPVRDSWKSDGSGCFVFDVYVGSVSVHSLKTEFESKSAALVERTKLLAAINRGLAYDKTT